MNVTVPRHLRLAADCLRISNCVMDRFGFYRVSAAFPLVKVADVKYNEEQTLASVRDAVSRGCELLVLPELGLTGYTCGDLFHQQLMLTAAEVALARVAEATAGTRLMAIVGVPLMHQGRLYNCAAACANGEVKAVVPKSYLPNYNEFYEKRWFASGKNVRCEDICICGESVPFGTDVMLRHGGASVGIEICEDLWVPAPPSNRIALAGADVIANLSATDELIGKHDYLRSLVSGQSARLRCVYAYASAGAGESSTDAVYAGNALIAEDGRMLCESPRFSESAQAVTADVDLGMIRADRRHIDTYYENDDEQLGFCTVDTCVPADDAERQLEYRTVKRHPFVPSAGPMLDDRCREVTSIQTAGLVQRLRATGCRHLTVGISGGLDSTLALLISVKAFDALGLDRKGIYAITMPGFGTTHRTHTNAHTIMQRLGVTAVEIPIADAVRQHFHDIRQDENVHDVTYENCQARERTQILMDYGNRVGAMVLGTGDLSELALGWCTYNADHISMYSVNTSVPKTLVRHLVEWIACREEDAELRDALMDIVNTPVSPELIPADKNGNISQKTEDLVGPYELHDFFLYYTMRYGFTPRKVFMLAMTAFAGTYDADVVRHWLRTFYRRFFAQQFKRSCLPDGPKTGSVSISPRADWRMPSDACSRIWLDEVDAI